jgi:Ca2+-binding EF-hand superfamily protein
MSGVTDMKLVGPNFTKDVILQIFTFLDTDKDNRLKYADFCSLVSKGR